MTAGTDGPVWLGIDVGTQSVRCVAVDHRAATVASGTHPLRGRRAGPRHEQDPHEWWSALATACGAAMREVGGRPVRGLALCATSGTVLLVSPELTPLSPGLMYDDSRAGSEARRAVEAGDELWRRLGYRPQASWALPKLLWLLDAAGRPAGARMAHQADYLTGRLAGRRTAADSSHALKSGYDLDAERWPAGVFDALGIPAAVLPEVVRPGTPVGTVGGDAAEATGIPEGTPIIAGMTDGCAALLGSGTVGVGAWNSVLGTTLVLKGITAERLRDPLGAVYSHRAPDGSWLPGGASSSGAGVLTARFGGADLGRLTEQAAVRPQRTVVTYPLVSRGERFPFVAGEAERFTLGEPRDDVDAYAALLRGVAFVERLCFDYLDLLGAPVDGPLTLTGGGARNRFWCGLRASTLGRTVGVPRDADPAVGMALLARSPGSSLTALAGDPARDGAGGTDVVEPNPDDTAVLTEGYLALVDALLERGWLPADLAAHARKRSTG
ncbi:sugar (pentulose or hexulose) kinase [Prauserella shujinwangii]|uniref:Sugar (Pentulose or hexulose) kinase n=1 Tax=Prauserella shujinwangii TaxID=1453103 RepID=A0A2T0LTU8_9PSEU|nr:FGGY family carbohydrate kinase [Prauserella shujinwangii]PRX47159.1 sugar (pentulose or hexulose) kinase [Prauserella shujinwangii]